MLLRYKNKFVSVCFSLVTSIWSLSAEQWVHLCSAWLTWLGVKLPTWQRCCEAVRGPAPKLHALLNFWPFERCVNNDARPGCFLKWSHVCLFFVWMFCCTPVDSGLSVWLTVICFVSWWWRPVIDGRDPGHLRSTAVDSFEIESSSRSVTMSSLRFWLGRRPSTPQHWGDFMNFNWGHKCECTWKLCWGGGGLNQEFRPDNHNNHSKEEGKVKQQGFNRKLRLLNI